MTHVFNSDSSAEPAPVESGPATPVKGAAIDKPVDLSPLLYRDTNHKPYAAKYFEMETVLPDLDSDLRAAIDVIDDYYEEQANKGVIENSKVGYQEFIKKYERMTETKYADKRNKIAAIADFIHYLQKRESYG